MIRAVILSYTERGGQLNRKIAEYLHGDGDVAVSCLFGSAFSSTAALLEGEWQRTSAFVFICAAGIAVRHIAPFMTDKLHDPAVLVTDEAGEFVIPVLSGHVGGGVALARRLAEGLGAQAVITTATDVEKRFAPDVFAVSNHLCVPDAAAAREVSAAVLRGEPILLRTGIPVSGNVPPGVSVSRESGGICRLSGKADPADGRLSGASADGEAEKTDLTVGYPDGRTVCRLAHRSYIIGVGCQKGKSGGELYGFLREVCEESGIDLRRIAAVASIDVKREETGIWELARRLGAEYEVFSAEELSRVGEAVHASAFVERTVGVDNVCERSALCLAKRWAAAEGGSGTDGAEGGDYRLVAEKRARDGMTFAVARFTPAAYRWCAP